jgi:hypothetical protein
MLIVFRPSFEVVKEGRISLRSEVIGNKRHQFDSDLFWSILGHSFGMVKGKGRQKMIYQKKSLKHIPGQSIPLLPFYKLKET